MYFVFLGPANNFFNIFHPPPPPPPPEKNNGPSVNHTVLKQKICDLVKLSSH